MKNCKWFRSVILIGALATAAGLPCTATARGAQNDELKKMTGEVVNTIANLPDYTAYDWLTFSIAERRRHIDWVLPHHSPSQQCPKGS